MDYNDENDELIGNAEYGGDDDRNVDLEDSLGDEVSFCISILLPTRWYFPSSSFNVPIS